MLIVYGLAIKKHILVHADTFHGHTGQMDHVCIANVNKTIVNPNLQFIMTERHLRRVYRLIERGMGACIVCDRRIDSIDKALIVVLDNTKPGTMHNLGLRHATCSRSKYRPVHPPDELVQIVEWIITSTHKECVVCKKSVVDVEFEHLVLVVRGSVKNVAHLVCVERESDT